MSVIHKVIVVEGKHDKVRLLEVLDEPVHVICTHGTMSIEKLDDMYDLLLNHHVFIMTDADKAGRKIRNWFKKHFSEANHIHIDSKYGEVAKSPHMYLAKLLTKHQFNVKQEFQLKGNQNRYEFNHTFAFGSAI